MVQYEPGEQNKMHKGQVLRHCTGLSLATLLPLSAIAAPLHAPPATPAAAASKSGSTKPEPQQKRRAATDDLNDLLNRVRNTDSSDPNSYPVFIGAHHKLLGLYWREIASDSVASLPLVTLMGSRGRFSGCGRTRSVNAYCPESNEIILSTRGIKGSQRFSNAKRNLLGLTVLAHEWGHHVNHHSNRGSYSKREEDSADWRAGRYLAWLMTKDALSVKDFTDAANLFFSIGDFHFESPHNNPKARYQAFIAGVSEEQPTGLQSDGWSMDTSETFSRVINRRGSRSDGQPGPKKVTAEVYRFEIERGGQIAGNIFSAFLGVVNCSTGSSSSCANALNQQGKAKPDGWYRLRTMRINCERRNFDIDNDGISRQPLKGDRKGQAALIAKRACAAERAPEQA